MNDLVAMIVEPFLSLQPYTNVMFDSKEYAVSFWIMLLIPMLVLLVFYRFWDKVNSKRYHWILFCTISIILVFMTSVGRLYNSGLMEFIDNPNYDGCVTYMYQYSGLITLYSLVLLLAFTFVFRFISPNNRYNPL